MKFPVISQYLESLQNPHHRFKNLLSFKPVTDRSGNPVLLSGNNAVIFKIEIEGNYYALKCFTRYTSVLASNYLRISEFSARIDSPYIPCFRFLKDEMFVFDEKGVGSYYSVLLREWIEGISLGEYLKDKCASGDTRALASIAQEFDDMALWLLRQEFAHGDLKHDNIMVKPDGSLVLLDFDGMFVPAMSGEPAQEFGSLSYQHPGRTQDHFSRHTDDYSIAMISGSLHILSNHPNFFDLYHDGENIIFNPHEILSNRSKAYHDALKKADKELLNLLLLLQSPDPYLPTLHNALTRLQKEKEKQAKESYLVVEECDNGWKVAINKEKAFGFTDPKGQVVIDFLFTDAKGYHNGFAPVKKHSRWAFIDQNGYLCHPYTLEEASVFSENMVAVKRDGKWGYLDTDFKKKIKFQYEEAGDFNQGLACVRKKGRYGYIDSEGQWIISPRFDFARSFSEGLACVRQEDGKYGYIDRGGKFLIAPVYDMAGNFRKGRARVEQHGAHFWIDVHGKKMTSAEP